MNEHLQELLGKSEAELLESAFFQSIPETAVREEYDDAIYYEFPKDGVAFDICADERRVVAVFITCHDYVGVLPCSLTPSMSSADVRGVLGKPTTKGGGKGKKTPLGPVNPWERFEWEDVAMNVTYEQDRKSIKTVCLMLPSAVPRE